MWKLRKGNYLLDSDKFSLSFSRFFGQLQY